MPADAAERSRTSTGSRPHGPEPCASTSSATAARSRQFTAYEPPAPRRLPSPSCDPRLAPPPAVSLKCPASSPLSSRGLGRRILSPETGVRIPVAVPHESPANAGFSRSRSGLDRKVCPETCPEVVLETWDTMQRQANRAISGHVFKVERKRGAQRLPRDPHRRLSRGHGVDGTSGSRDDPALPPIQAKAGAARRVSEAFAS